MSTMFNEICIYIYMCVCVYVCVCVCEINDDGEYPKIES